MTSNWIQHVKKYQSEHPGMSYKQAMSEAKNTYVKCGSCEKEGAGLKQVVRKAKNTVKRARKTAKQASKVVDQNKNLINLVAPDAMDKIEQVQAVHKQFEETIGGKINIGKVARKVKNTTKRARKIAKDVAPIVDMVAPEASAPLHTAIALTGGSLGSEKGKAKYRVGGSFAVPKRGGHFESNNSSMLNPLHPSFNPPKPKPVRRRQVEN